MSLTPRAAGKLMLYPRHNFQIGREARALRSDVVVVATYFYLALRGELLPVV